MATALRRYYRGHNLVTLREVQAAQSRVYHFDHQGTTQCLTDSTGAVTDRFAADAWGVQVKRTGSSINRQWYAGNWGYVVDRGTRSSLILARERYLSPNSASWISQDYFLSAWHSLYAYCGDSPVLYVDPTGLFFCVVKFIRVSDIRCQIRLFPAGKRNKTLVAQRFPEFERRDDTDCSKFINCTQYKNRSSHGTWNSRWTTRGRPPVDYNEKMDKDQQFFESNGLIPQVNYGPPPFQIFLEFIRATMLEFFGQIEDVQSKKLRRRMVYTRVPEFFFSCNGKFTADITLMQCGARRACRETDDEPLA